MSTVTGHGTDGETLPPADAAVRRALAAGRAERRTWEGVPYVRLKDDHRPFERGTVIVDGRTVPAYPRIGRIFVLDHGVRRTFRQPFSVEEKIDGYNVRIVRSSRGVLLPLTRGGWVCPFSADRLPDLADLEPLLADHPDLVVCAEIAGRNNPYLDVDSPRVSGDVGLFVFDLMRLGRRGHVPLSERDALLARYGVPTAPRLGTYGPKDVTALRALVLQLDREGAEGIVLKPPGPGVRVKYVTPSINLADLREEDELLADLPPEFFVGRILRLAIGLEELGLLHTLPDVERRLGEALLPRFVDALRDLKDSGVVAKTFRVFLRSEASADRLMDHLTTASRKVQVREASRARHDGYVELVFKKVYPGATSRLKTLIGGQYVYD